MECNMMKVSKFVVSLMSVAVFAAACSSDSAKEWEPMEWSTETALDVRLDEGCGSAKVPAQGHAFEFVCTNYPDPWFVAASPAQNQCTTYAIRHSGFYFGKIEHNVFTIEFAPNETKAERELQVKVSVGGAFYAFTFVQQAADALP